jgi:hypothetical protein
MNVQAEMKTSDPRASLRLELERVLEQLGPEDLELVLDLASRLTREHAGHA